jgi:hypothetical protein
MVTIHYRNATAADAPVLAEMNHQLIRDDAKGSGDDASGSEVVF